MLFGAMRRQLLLYLAAGLAVSLVVAWFAWPGNLLKSQTRTQQRLSYLLAPGLATGLGLATLVRSLAPSLANPFSKIVMAVCIAGAVTVQSSVFGFLFWLAARLLGPLRALVR